MYTQSFNVPDSGGNASPALDIKPVLSAQQQQLLDQAQTRFDSVIDADGKIVTVSSPIPFWLAGMPSPVEGTYELDEVAIPSNEEMCRNLSASDLLKVGVRIPSQLVGKELANKIAAVLSGRQADGVDNNQINHTVDWARPKIGGIDSLGASQPPIDPLLLSVGSLCGGLWNFHAR